MAPELPQRPERVGACEGEGTALLGRQRLRQDEEPVEEVYRIEAGGHEVGEAQSHVAEDAAERRAEDEAEAEDRADETEAGRALLGRCDVGHVRARAGEARPRDARDDAPDEEPPQRGRQAAEQVARRRAEERHEDDRPPPEAIAQPAEHRREDELHRRVERHEVAEVVRRGAQVVAQEACHEARRHRDDEPEPERVEKHGDEHERRPRAARASGGHGKEPCL